MVFELSTAGLLGLLAGAAVLHALLFLAARSINPLYMLAAVILVLAPFSAAPEFAAGELVRWIRGYSLVLLVLWGLLKFRGRTLGWTSTTWGAFVLLYACGVFMSEATILQSALWLRLQTCLVVAAGFLMAFSIRDRRDLLHGLRFVAVAGGVLAFVVLLSFAANPVALVQWGRFRMLGVVPTRIASNAAPLALVSIYLALNERSVRWRTIAYAASAALVLVIIMTASRGSAAVVIVGFLIQLVPRGGRRLRMLLLPIFAAGLTLLFLDVYGSEVQVERLLSTKNTRTEVWAKATNLILQEPLFGHGASGNMHSIYMQAAVDIGLLGLALMLAALAMMAIQGLWTYRFLRRHPTHAFLAVLPVTLIATALMTGIVENSLLLPSSFALLMSLGVGLIDRLPSLATGASRRRLQRVRYAMGRRGFRGDSGLGKARGTT